MVVIVMENASISLRGELTRWLFEVKAGVFLGTISALVREKLWEKVCEEQVEGGALIIFNAKNEQGFEILSHGNPHRAVIDLDGIQLIRML